MDNLIPKFKKDAFNCPYCGAYSHMLWKRLGRQNSSLLSHYYEAECSKCKKSSLWLDTDPNQFEDDSQGDLVLPDVGISVAPEPDMPENVKKDYYEAARIHTKSPRASAALLRLGLQKLCRHLGEKGKNINDDLRALNAKGVLSKDVIKVADTVRITGNNAVHPGEMSDEDIDYIASKMFFLINFIVKKAISEPKELEELYNMTPESSRQAAEKQDSNVTLK